MASERTAAASRSGACGTLHPPPRTDTVSRGRAPCKHRRAGHRRGHRLPAARSGALRRAPASGATGPRRVGQPGGREQRRAPAARSARPSPATRPDAVRRRPGGAAAALEHPQRAPGRGRRAAGSSPRRRLAASATEVADQVEHVGRAGDQGGAACCGQLVAAGRHGRGDRPGHGHHRPGQLAACPAVFSAPLRSRGLDHDRARGRARRSPGCGRGTGAGSAREPGGSSLTRPRRAPGSRRAAGRAPRG